MTQVTFTDRATVTGTHRTADGYLAASAKIARTGIQQYSGFEVGKPAMPIVRIYRSPEEVFDAKAMASAAHKPITVDHPEGSVDASRWTGMARGWTGEGVARDGDTLRVSMMVADAAAIAEIEAGKRELSCGYTCDLDWTPGTTPAGEAYDARQVGIRINHVAIVGKGRAGAECRIGDAARGGFSLRDAAGQPIRLMDIDTGAMITLNEDLIRAIEAEAAKLGMPLKPYLSEVLRYSEASTKLSGETA